MHGQRILRVSVVAMTVAVALVFAESSIAQTVTWGVNGAGGSGTWDLTTADWFDGTNNVSWPSGGNAIFAGASGGTVAIDFGAPGPVASLANLQHTRVSVDRRKHPEQRDLDHDDKR